MAAFRRRPFPRSGLRAPMHLWQGMLFSNTRMGSRQQSSRYDPQRLKQKSRLIAVTFV
jgi:hypothetical protein